MGKICQGYALLMKNPEQQAAKELYRELRHLSCQQLRDLEIPRYDSASSKERLERVALVRAVGVVFSESGTKEEKAQAKAWLLRLLDDSEEKVRRYAMAALPKLGAGAEEEAALLSVLKTTDNEREKKFLGKSLDKIGGEATLELIESGADMTLQTEQKVKASVARLRRPTEILMDIPFVGFERLRIHLRCRKGLESIVREEFETYALKTGKFRFLDQHSGLVAITPQEAFTLGDLFSLRCFASVSFVLGSVKELDEEASIEAWALLIASPLSKSLFESFSKGANRYRLSFEDKGAQRGAVRRVVTRAYELCPEILNDAREAPWAIDIHPRGQGTSVELRPRLTPDPRLFYRVDDVPAASHPPLAACMAWLSRGGRDEVVWDPFCGSGLELIERALRGGVKKLVGTDLSEEAVTITSKNVAAAGLEGVETRFVCCDFRDYSKIEELELGSVGLVISNPPLGRRVRIVGLRELFYDLFSASSAVLKKGGLLVFVNPFRMESPEPSLKLQSRQTVDLGGFNCQLEVYRKL